MRCSETDEAMFMTALRGHEGIETFVGSFFEFLGRKTDFFLVMTDAKAAAGFPPGFAFNTTKESFLRGQRKALAARQPALVPHVRALNKPDTYSPDQWDALIQATPSVQRPAPKAQQPLKQPEAKKSETIPPRETVEKPKLEPTAGRRFADYCWTQTLEDVTVELLPGRLGRLVTEASAEFEAGRVRVVDGQGVELLSWPTAHAIEPGNCTWFVEDRSRLLLHLEKRTQAWWDRLLEEETPIDLTTVESVKRFEDCEPDLQGQLRKMMHDENEKREGRPTSDQQALNSLLGQAWDAEGSPFKGQPFDPSKVSLGGGMPPPQPPT